MTITRTRQVHRIVYGTGRQGGHHLMPEIDEIGWGRFAVAHPGHLEPHRHLGAFEICLIVSGEVEWETQDRSYVLRAGDLFITRPDELHWGHDSAMQPCTLYWLHLDQETGGDTWLGLPHPLGNALRQRLKALPRQLKDDSGKAAWLIRQLFEHHQGDEAGLTEAPLLRAAARACLHQLVIELVRLGERPQEPRDMADLPASVRQAMAIIGDPVREPLTAREIAAGIGMPVTHLNDLFIRHLGISLALFSSRERMRAARWKLRETPKSVTEIAHELGFSSSQHFATAFKRMTGTSPSIYRAQAGASGQHESRPPQSRHPVGTQART